MARGKNKKPRSDRKVEAQERDAAVAAVSELVATLACPQSAIEELAMSCENVLDQMDVSCGFARFAATTWAGQPNRYAEIDPIARELIAEYERHAHKLGEILDRLAPFVDDEDHADHDDLEPRQVFERIQPMLVASDDVPA